MSNNITTYMKKLQELTKTNLDILQGLNDSFYTKQNHLTVKIDDVPFYIPSYLSLENKINNIQENFENLVNAPKTGEAYFNFDGNSQSIEMRSFNNSPMSVVLNKTNNFGVESNNIFKDILSPKPYLNFNLDMSADISEVMMKKIIPINTTLRDTLISSIGTNDSTAQLTYEEVYKKLITYQKDVDYIEYDKKIQLPVKQPIGEGLYVIDKIISDTVDDDLVEHITLSIKSEFGGDISQYGDKYIHSLSYKAFNNTIEKPLSKGNMLLSYNGNTQLEIEEINYNTNTLVLKVGNGEYISLNKYDDIYKQDPMEFSKDCILKFYNTSDTSISKAVHVPLEEDKYVYVVLAPMNSRMNIQASYGTGLIIATDKLKKDDGTNTSFTKYYNDNVKNIGDILYNITNIMNGTINQYSQSEFKSLTSYKPTINKNNLDVVKINTHINNSKSIQQIKSLYSQKKNYTTQLDDYNSKIDDINKQLSFIAFDSASSDYTTLNNNLITYTTKRNTIVTSLSKIVNEISIAANDSEVPISDEKYHIRGFYDLKDVIDSLPMTDNHICGIKVQYRYKGINSVSGSAVSMTEDKYASNDSSDNNNFIFSDWNIMSQPYINKKHPKINGIDYKYVYDTYNGNKNEPSFNQVDIPITSGETVDIRLKVLYDFGAPFITTESKWSDIINIEFPDKFKDNVSVLNIINENNDDIETQRFTNILTTNGVTKHIADAITDQNITYFHKPENISSGYYTNERRIIPLKDQLVLMMDKITEIEDIINNTSNTSLNVTATIGDSTSTLAMNSDNSISLIPYNILINSGSTSYDNTYKIQRYDYDKDSESVTSILTTINLNITNNSKHTTNIYSVFPGNRSKKLTSLSSADGYKNFSLYFKNDSSWGDQSMNQLVTFRTTDIYTKENIYGLNGEGNLYGQSGSNQFIANPEVSATNINTDQLFVYPCLKDIYSLCLDSDGKGYYVLQPGFTLTIPINVFYAYGKTITSENLSTTLSFDIRTSLYSDPINYCLNINSSSTGVDSDVVIKNNNKSNEIYNSIIL